MHKLCLCCYFYTAPDEHFSKKPALTVDLSNISDGILSKCLCKIIVSWRNFIENNIIVLLTDINDLSFLMVALAGVAYQWEHLGDQLGLTHGRLKEIEKEKLKVQMDCMREMLAAWLQGQGGECSKQALKTALQKIGCSF